MNKALLPSEILPPLRDGEGEIFTSKMPQVREWHPSVFMRRLGYTRNPDICHHTVKGFTPRDGWWCKECGENL